MTVAVIGAGPAGITAAYELAKRGIRVHVYEAGNAVGGLARSIRLWNQTVDIGPHRFYSSDRRVNSLWLDVVQRDYRMIQRQTRIYYRGRFFHYPLKPMNALLQLGPIEAARCIASFGKQRLVPIEHGDDFESWVISRFGDRLFSIFFKAYSEKLWGIPCKELDSDFAAQRIKRLNLYEAIRNAVTNGRDNRHKTLVDEFAYPTGGTGMVYERMADAVQERGGAVHIRTPVQRVLTAKGTVIGLELADGRTHEYEQVVSSMPITLLVTRLDGVPEPVRVHAESLRFRNTILIYLKIECDSLFHDQWLYIHSPELGVGRITNFRNWTPELYGEQTDSILALEYWANDSDPIWTEPDDRLIDRARRELRATGLIGDAQITNGKVMRIRRCYPVYDRAYRLRLKPIEDFLSSIRGLQAIGRYGAFKYNNQDHSILMGILAAENIYGGTNHNLWEVNTDYDSYQESALITESGLASTPHA